MAKGDAEKLRADLDDGHTKVANLLIEGLCCAPITAAEYAVFLFIIRRTYGWARAKDRTTGKSDAMTAPEIAEGTALSRSGVHKAIQSLCQCHMIIATPVKEGNWFAYGVNPNLSEWGLETVEWATCKRQLRDARERHIYNRAGAEHSPKRVRGLTETGESTNLNGGEHSPEQVRGSAVSPTGTGAPSPLQQGVQPKRQQGVHHAREDARSDGPDFCVWRGWKRHGNGDGHVRADDPGLDPRVREFILSLWPRNPDKMRPGEDENWDDLLAKYLENPNHPDPRRWFDAEQRRRDQEAGLHVF